MGKQSTREHKNIYQIYREEQGLTREKASEKMEGVSASRIEKIEYEHAYNTHSTKDVRRQDTIEVADVPDEVINELHYFMLTDITSYRCIMLYYIRGDSYEKRND